MPAPKIVLDTNILNASIGTKSPFRWIFDCLISGKIILCVSNDILFEYHEIIARKTNERVAENVVNFTAVNPSTKHVSVYFNFGLISDDASDNKFVDCAIASNANCLVSNDRHFRRLQTLDFPKVTVPTLREFEERYRAGLT